MEKVNDCSKSMNTKNYDDREPFTLQKDDSDGVYRRTRGLRIEKEETDGSTKPYRGLKGKGHSIPLHRYVREHAERSIEESESFTEDSEFRRSGEGYKSRTWEFTRAMKARSEFMGLSAEAAVKRIPWKYTSFESDDQLSFMREWEKVRVPLGYEKPLEIAFEMAESNPLFSDAHFVNYAKFLSAAAYLQRIVGDQDIHLTVRKVGDLMRVHFTMVTVYRDRAVKEGFLRITEEHTTNKGTRFRFDLGRVPKLTDTDS